jgi:predicted CXXCH cytochrome family protein
MRTRPQAPSSKPQAPEKRQVPSPRRLEAQIGVYNLALLWSLELGVWSFRKLGRILALALVLAGASAWAESVVDSVHNLSVYGTGSIKSMTESNACVFCHTTHHSGGATPLWNHTMASITNYIVYSSPTLEAMSLSIPQPNGASRLCLSCHDGTVALGSVSSRTTPISVQQNGTIISTMPAGPSNLGTDLSGDHPISFVYDSALAAKDPQLKDPSTLKGKVRLDAEGRLQCTACHNPHDNQFGKFLAMDNTASALCLSCHNVADWSLSAHAMSGQVIVNSAAVTKALNVGPGPAGAASPGKTGIARPNRAAKGAQTVAANGCGNCHVSHLAEGKKQLLKSFRPEQNCLPCHDGSQPGIKNVAADFQKLSAHPITLNSASHAPNENVVNPPQRHVTCSDCHNPHATTTAAASPRRASGALAGVVGLSATGATIARASQQYELCFRCHADSSARGPARVRRQFVETNTRLQFATTASSYHPIESPGKNPSVPSLLGPWTTSSLVTCTDCHNSDQGQRAGGTGANGPHGSVYAPLLERQLLLTDYNPENPVSYGLCYKCHSRDSILGDRSFRAVNSLGQDRGHRFHVVDAKAACTTCHDSHGVPTAKGLMNFNLDYVSASSNGRLEYISGGPGSGNCSLSCHGKDHVASGYPTLISTAALRRQAKHR